MLTEALNESNVQPFDSLETPAQREEAAKKRNVGVRLARKQRALVAEAAANNGSEALAAELTAQQQGRGQENRAPTEELRATNNAAANAAVDQAVATKEAQSLPKQKRRKTVVNAVPPAARELVPGPPVLKCEGCVHCDLLELKMMEPNRIKHYLKRHEFLERAQCAGDCAKSIKAIHTVAPKSHIYYCDEGKKGFDAPEEDPLKMFLDCGLVLCLACHGTRSAAYDLANSKDGAGGPPRRISRRHR
jgi:hypothetical protein